MLQVLIAIGVNDDVLPNSKEWWIRHLPDERVRYNISECVITAGVLALDIHYNLRRGEFSDMQLRGLSHMIENLQFHILRMFGVKQLLLSSDKPYGGIKLHMMTHYPKCIAYYGPPHIFDMIRYDHLHITLTKQPFTQTSKRYSHISKSLMEKVSM